MKRGFDAALQYFATNITDAYYRGDPHGWNLSQGLALLAKSLKEMDERLARVEKQLGASNEGRPHPK
jgi:hypothetical protein